MAGWNNAPFLQALGWATLNSIWQMALLWLCFTMLQQLFKLSGSKQYRVAVSCILLGFAWFLYTFFIFYFYSIKASFKLEFSFSPSANLLPLLLSSVSILYLFLLSLPALRIVNNLFFIQKLQTQGLQKASYNCRMFVEKTSRHLGIKKRVSVYLSKLVTSPVTVGFIKPIILLPFSAIANLSPQQVEAILLHEIAHIRRHDYIINLLLSFIQVLFYFNPFVTLFYKKIELEREICCDEMVLQFEYDKLSYASALLDLEKSSQKMHLAMAAADKNHLLHRIENIVGMKKKAVFKKSQLAGVFAGLLMLVVINALVFTGKKALPEGFSMNDFSQPASFFVDNETFQKIKSDKNISAPAKAVIIGKPASIKKTYNLVEETTATPPAYTLAPATNFLQVSFNETDVTLNTEQKEQVTKTVESTKKVLEIQWKEVDKAIGDAMTATEKKVAKREYLNEIDEIDWKSIERKLNAGYEKIDWNRIDGNVAEIMVNAKLDSLEEHYSITLAELNKFKIPGVPQTLPMPDVSVQELQKAKTNLKGTIREIQKIRSKKVVHL